MTGNAYIDAVAYAGFGVLGLIFIGIPLWMLWDRFRPASGEHTAIGREVGEVRADVPAPSPKPASSPFRRKREVKS